MLNLFGLILMSLMLTLWSGCKGQIRPQFLPLPKDLLKSSFPHSPKSDSLHITNDYALINVGDPIPDGGSIDKPTDAALLEKRLDADQAKIFIHLPDDINKVEHIYKLIHSASLRIKNRGNEKHQTLFVDLGELDRQVKLFQFDDDNQREFFLSMAKKINEEIKSNSTLVINIDALSKRVTPEEFVSLITKPDLIILSKYNYDSQQPFKADEKNIQFFPKGLRLGHMYGLMAKRFARSNSPQTKAQAQTLALVNAKIMGALKPFAGLGEMAIFFKAVDDLELTENGQGDFEKDVSSRAAELANYSYPFVQSLDLGKFSLADIQKQVDDNVHAFTETTVSTQITLKELKEIREEALPKIKADAEDIRSKVQPLPNVISDIAEIKQNASKIQGIKDDAVAIRKDTDDIKIIKRKTDNLPDQTNEVLQDIRREVGKAASQLDDETMRKLRALPDNLGQEIADLNNKISTELTTRLQDLIAKLPEGFDKQLIDDLKSSVLVLQKFTDEHIAKIAGLPLNMSTEIDAIKNQLVTELPKSLTEILTKIPNLDPAMMNNIQTQVDELQRLINAQGGQIAAVPGQLATQVQKVLDAVGNLPRINPETLNQITSDMKDLQNNLRQELADLNNKISTELTTRLQDLIAKLPEGFDKKLIDDLKASVLVLQKFTDEHIAKIAGLPANMSTEIDDIKKQLVTELPKSLAEILTKIPNLDPAMMNNIQTQVDELQRLINAQGGQIAAVPGQLATQVQEVLEAVGNLPRINPETLNQITGNITNLQKLITEQSQLVQNEINEKNIDVKAAMTTELQKVTEAVGNIPKIDPATLNQITGNITNLQKLITEQSQLVQKEINEKNIDVKAAMTTELQKVTEAIGNIPKIDPATLNNITNTISSLNQLITNLDTKVNNSLGQIPVDVQRKIADEVTKLDRTLNALPKFDATTLKQPIEDLKNSLIALSNKVVTGQDQVKNAQEQTKIVQEMVTKQVVKVEEVLKDIPKINPADINAEFENLAKILDEIKKKTDRLKFTKTYAVKSESPSFVGLSEADFADIAPHPDIDLNLDVKLSRIQWFHNVELAQRKLIKLREYFYQSVKLQDDCGDGYEKNKHYLNHFYDDLDVYSSRASRKIIELKNKIDEIILMCD